MHESVLLKLEYPAVLDRLATLCRFSVAAERAKELGPSGQPDHVRYLLQVTEESVDALNRYPDLSVGGARDIREEALKAARGSRLAPTDLLRVQDTLRASRALRQTFARMPDAVDRYPSLSEFVEHLADLPDLERAISQSIGPRGDILDTASDALSRIRRDVRVAHSRLMDRLNNLITGGRYAAAVQDAIITMRDNRYVIPVRADARGAVPGIVHDTSASGQTLFIEPFDVVDLNNRRRERQAEEQHEIERILDDLTVRVGSRVQQLTQMVEAIAAVDLALAKARLASDLRASKPILFESVVGKGTPDPQNSPGHHTHQIRLIKARHPLLDQATVVPTDIHLGEDFRVLVITGPNTGGKTVALKTVGLLTLMAQTGLYIPADPDSIVTVFPAIFADIGDEQSIAQSLSTFSSHMRTIIGMLDQVTPDSLVLLDELGAGTDPQEGSALARALLGELFNRGPLVIATTHYSEVKAFAYATPGVENASVEFDVQTLAPTYRMTIGVPGQSNALAIAKRLGLQSRVREVAASYLTPDDRRTDALLQDIRRRREESEAALRRAQEVEGEAQQLRRLAARALRSAEDERRVAREDTLAEAEGMLTEVRETLRRLQKDRETLSATREHVETRRKEADQATDVVRELRRAATAPQRRSTPTVTATRPIAVGDLVRVVPLETEGEVVALLGDEADVRLGAMKMRQPLAALERLGRVKAREGEKNVTRPKLNEAVSIEIDLRGFRASEVPDILEGYLESAYRSGLPFVRIIHGKGTGALREVVRTHLHRHPVIEKAALAPVEQGGDGVTIAHLRE